MTKVVTPYEAFELEMWNLRNARERHATVPVLLDFAVRQRSLTLPDAVEATLHIFRRYRPRYRHNAEVTSRSAQLVPVDRGLLQRLPGLRRGRAVDPREPDVLDIDLIADVEDSGIGRPEAWSHLLARLGDIGMDVDFHDNPDVVERTGAYTLNVHTAVPGSVPPAELDTANAWYVLRLAPELGGGRSTAMPAR